MKDFAVELGGNCGAQSVTDYIETLLQVLCEVARQGEGRKEMLSAQFMKFFMTAINVTLIKNSAKDSRFETESQVKLFIIAARLVRFLVHVNLPDCVAHQAGTANFEVLNSMFKAYLWAEQHKQPEMQAEAFIVLSHYVGNSDAHSDTSAANPADSFSYFGVVRGLEGLTTFYSYTASILIPEDTTPDLKEVMSEELKLASIRVMKYVACRDSYSVDQSRGFTVEKVIQYFLCGVRDRTGPPRNMVGYKACQALQSQGDFIDDNTEAFHDHVVPLTKWLAHFDIKVVEAALGCLTHLVRDKVSQMKFLKAGGVSALVNVLANVNVNLQDLATDSALILNDIEKLEQIILQRAMQVILVVITNDDAK